MSDCEKEMMKWRQIWVKIKYIKHSKDGGYPTVIRWVLIIGKYWMRWAQRKDLGTGLSCRPT